MALWRMRLPGKEMPHVPGGREQGKGAPTVMGSV